MTRPDQSIDSRRVGDFRHKRCPSDNWIWPFAGNNVHRAVNNWCNSKSWARCFAFFFCERAARPLSSDSALFLYFEFLLTPKSRDIAKSIYVAVGWQTLRVYIARGLTMGLLLFSANNTHWGGEARARSIVLRRLLLQGWVVSCSRALLRIQWNKCDKKIYDFVRICPLATDFGAQWDETTITIDFRRVSDIWTEALITRLDLFVFITCTLCTSRIKWEPEYAIQGSLSSRMFYFESETIFFHLNLPHFQYKHFSQRFFLH